MAIWGALSAIAKIGKKVKQRKRERIQQQAAQAGAEAGLMRAKIGKAQLGARQAEEGQQLTSSFAGKNIAGGPAAAAQAGALAERQRLQNQETQLGIEQAQRGVSDIKKIKKTRKGLLGLL